MGMAIPQGDSAAPPSDINDKAAVVVTGDDQHHTRNKKFQSPFKVL
jgi:hypothetical protein